MLEKTIFEAKKKCTCFNKNSISIKSKFDIIIKVHNVLLSIIEYSCKNNVYFDNKFNN